ncbi:MAG: photosynthetic complex putative assembly protein PuhB [Pseudomonadota bacterium]
MPEALPRGERVVWQGRPSLPGLLLGTFHLRKLAVYFSVLIAIVFAVQVRGGGTLSASAYDVSGYAVAALVAMGILTVLAFLVAKTTTYAVTSRRVVIQCGIAIPMTVSFPFSKIETADVRARGDGSGEIALLPEESNPILYVLLFPHVKPFSVFRARPVLRGIPDARKVGDLLAGLMTEQLAGAGETRPHTETPKPSAKQSLRKDVSFWDLNAVPIALAVGITALTIGGAWMMQEKNAALRVDPATQSVATVRLFFEDIEDGGVNVVDATTGQQVALLARGEGNFVRGTLRGLVRLRRQSGFGAEQPFALHQTEAGRLILEDPATGTEIDLIAFGEPNAEAFRRFVETSDTTVSAPRAADEGLAQVALSKEESGQ